ncbi:MAG TPA: 30S ribosome-binding factor RbfA [Candidatus Omnitrophota bacterium]|nr:30S ribosome-binding factor RbfA [Candidatus Omnitrophota bacterium]
MGRMERVNEQTKRHIGEIVHRELSDPRLMFVSITHAVVSKDLKTARVYYSVLGDEAKVQLAQQGLDKARGIIRKQLAARLEMRFTPELIFIYDESIAHGAQIEKTIQELQDEP